MTGIDGSQINTRAIDAVRVVGSSVTSSELGPGSVDTLEIIDGSVTPAKLDRAYQAPLGTLSKDANFVRPITGEAAPTSVEVSDEAGSSFPDASTTGIRATFDIPADYDTTGDVTIFLEISASTSSSGDFRVQTDYRINGGALAGTSDATVTPEATLTDKNRVGPIRTISGGTLAGGDGLVVLVRRLGGDGADTHTGNMQLFRVILRYAV